MRKTLIVALGALLLVLSACSNTTPTTQTSPSAEASEPTGVDTAERAAAVTDVRSTLPAVAPERVVVMSVALAEILDSLGIQPAGVPTSQNPLPASLDEVPRVGTVIAPDVEKIAELEPDLVLGPASIKDSLEKHLSATELTTAYVPTDSLDDLVHTTLAFGDLFGKVAEAEALVAQVDDARAAAGDASPVKVLILFGQSEEFSVLNDLTFAGGLAADLGATNVATELGLEESYSPLSLEQVIVADPDVILFLAHGDLSAAEKGMKEITEGNQAWQDLRAVEENRVHPLDANVFFTASLLNAPAAYRDLASVLTA